MVFKFHEALHRTLTRSYLWRSYLPAGTQIGNLGNTGNSSGPHIHEALHFTSLSNNNPYANWLNMNGYLGKYDKNNWYSNVNNYKR